jgi:16S rRNA (cytosine1402-N4)-methyltransferase
VSSLHTPVLLQETLSFLQLKPNATVVDATLGDGGHAEAILEQTAPNGQLIGFDLDADALERARTRLTRFGRRVTFIHDSYRNLTSQLHAQGFHTLHAVLADLGVSSGELASSQRGFSFQTDGPLDMRMDPSRQTLTAAEIVNTWPEEQLLSILRTYGQEPAARALAERLVLERKKQNFQTTLQLAQAVERTTRGRRRGGIHPATRTFQALRIAVNDELSALTDFLPQAVAALEPAGRLVVISFHSGEDRIVKTAFKQFAAEKRGTILTKHVTKPARAEVLANRRSRSAKLRAFEKLTNI